ncbi:MAG: hypothetical protein ACREVY_09245 [Gammaproteobacteria bacterium]
MLNPTHDPRAHRKRRGAHPTTTRRAQAVVAENRGAVARVMEVLMPLLEPPANQSVAD